MSVKSWSALVTPSVIDHHPKSISTQKKIYIDILEGRYSVLFGTRRALVKRLGHYRDIYIVYDNLASDIVFGQRHIPLWLMCEMLEAHGHVIHYLTTTPSVRILCDFLQNKKTIQYL